MAGLWLACCAAPLLAAEISNGLGAVKPALGPGVQLELDAATLDRFKIIEIDYDTSYEEKIARKSVVDWVWKVREAIAKHNMRRTASTRMIQRFERSLEIGESWSEAKACLLAGWSRDDLVRIGEA